MLMQFRPRLNQALLPPGHGTSNHVYRIDAENSYFLLVIGVEVGNVMLRTHLCEHPDDDAEEST